MVLATQGVNTAVQAAEAQRVGPSVVVPVKVMEVVSMEEGKEAVLE